MNNLSLLKEGGGLKSDLGILVGLGEIEVEGLPKLGLGLSEAEGLKDLLGLGLGLGDLDLLKGREGDLEGG